MTRSWWGWGSVDDAVTGEELDDLAATVAGVMGGRRPDPAAPAPLDGIVLPPPRVAPPGSLDVPIRTDDEVRVRHGHGQAFRDVVAAFEGRVPGAPDVVAAPRDPAEVRRLLEWADTAGVAVVPFGGGTSVVGGVNAPDRPTLTMSLAGLDRVLEVDPVSQAAHLQAGMFGPDIDGALRPHGLTLRHFPQSWEFSTLGGWLATRAGGHYATGATHIDDFVEAISAVTPGGDWQSRRLPASGAGPSPDRLLLGSEGSLGIITDAWVRVQPRPTFRARANALFGELADAVAALRALAQSGLQPANARLLDHVEAALAGASDGRDAVIVLGFESSDHPLDAWLQRAVELCHDHGGRCEDVTTTAGDRTGQAEGAAGSWRSTFLRGPYLRDALIRLGMVVETFETAVTWDRFEAATAAIGAAARRAVTDLCGVGSVSMRVTHCYPDGAAPYFTVIAPGPDGDRVAIWDEIKSATSDAIDAQRLTITHHHAVGRDHAPWYRRQVPAPFHAGLAALKDRVDPNGICNPGVLGLGG